MTGIAQKVEIDLLPYALGAVGLGLVTLLFGDVPLQWQPVLEGVPGHAGFVLASGALLIGGGIAAPWKDAGKARLILAVLYAAWVVAPNVPRFVNSPSVATLLGLAEILSLAVAGFLLGSGRYDRLAFGIFGFCPLVFGLSHLVYLDFTAAMVPGWIPPGGRFWAYATGFAHLAAGLAIASGILRSLAAALLAGMCGLFFLLVHIPRVAATPTSQAEWNMLFMSLSMAGAAWIVRSAATRVSEGRT